MREIAFDLRGLGWTPTVITQLGDVLAEFSRRVLEVSYRFWLPPPAPLQDNCSPEQLSCHVSALPHQSPDSKASGRGS